MKSPTLSIIIPVFNEKNTVEELVNKVDKVKINKEIIIIDDGSTDGTRKIIKGITTKSKLIKKFHTKNKGKGSAIKTGLKYASGKFTVIQDADLEYDPHDLEVLIHPAIQGRYNVVYGSRFKYAKQGIYSSRIFYLGGQFINWLANFLYNTNITDEPTCYKLIRTDLLKSLNLECTGFEFCPEVTAKVSLKNEPILELPISYYPRDKKHGKKITWKDGLIAAKTLIKYRLKNPFKSDPLTQGLEVVSEAKNYNYWIYNQFKDHVRGDVLEVGGGIGTFTNLLNKAKTITVTEIDPQYLKILKQKFKQNSKIKITNTDLSKSSQLSKIRKKFDLIILINVLEHIKDDQQMLSNLKSKLKPTGKIFIFVPAHQFLYSQWDQSVGHYRRYSKLDLVKKAEKSGLKIKKAYYFNPVGAIGWWINKIINTKPGNKGFTWQTKIFDHVMVPILVYFQKASSAFTPFGQSLILISEC